MPVWFEGFNEINCNIGDVANSLENLGEHYVGVVSLMPGMTRVELVEVGSDYVTIRTNEGLMKRTNISKQDDHGSVTVEFDEEYQAGSKVKATSHFRDEFTPSNTGVTHRVVMTDVEASGLLGFFYRTFGSSKTGNAFLTAYKDYFERTPS